MVSWQNKLYHIIENLSIEQMFYCEIYHNRATPMATRIMRVGKAYCEFCHIMRIAKQRLCKNSQIRVAKESESRIMRIAKRDFCKKHLYNEGRLPLTG